MYYQTIPYYSLNMTEITIYTLNVLSARNLLGKLHWLGNKRRASNVSDYSTYAQVVLGNIILVIL